MTTIITAVYGDFDELRPQVDQNIPADWVCFTDNPDLHAPAPWRLEIAPPQHDHPCLAAKVYKCSPPFDGDVIWIDGNMQVTARSFARESLQARRDGIAVWRHPRRDCIYDEAEASIGKESQGGKYDGQPILAQVDSYRAEHPHHAGLYACGTVAWDRDNPTAVAVGAAWLAECVHWSFQDQLSLPVALRRAGVIPGVFPLRQIHRSRRGFIENRWLRIHPHRVKV